MPTKFPIDYEPGKVQGLLIPKDQIIDPKPWPTDDIEGSDAFANDSEAPKVFTKTLTFKMSKKATRDFKRYMKRSSKLPRKLKKALKHVGFFRLPMERVETENGVAFKQTFGFGPKDGYPCTKWVNRACLKLKAQAIIILERQISADNYKQRGRHSIILPLKQTTEQLKTDNSNDNHLS